MKAVAGLVAGVFCVALAPPTSAVAQPALPGSGPIYPLPVNISPPLTELLPAGWLQLLQDSKLLLELDGDGHLDAMSLYRGCSTWRGNGDGTFGPATVYPAGDMPAVGVLADMNGDRIMDAVFPDTGPQLQSAEPGAVQVLLGRPDGAFDPPLTAPVEGDPWLLAAGDFDADGLVDVAGIVVGESWPQLMFMKGMGGGVLAPATFGVVHLNFVPFDIDAGDIDHDGELDLVIVDTDSLPSGCSGTGEAYRITRWLGQGDGTFAEVAPYLCTPIGANQLRLVDLTGDDGLDLLVGSGGITLLYENLGGGQFGLPDAIPETGVTSLPIETSGELLDYGGALAAFDSDGEPDLLTTGTLATPGLRLLPGLGGGSFGTAVATTYPGLTPFDIGDVDEDGRLDLCAGASGAFVVTRGLGDGTFEVPRSYTLGEDYISPGYWQWTTGDFNLDGVPDFAYCSYFSKLLVTLSERGTGYSPPAEYPPIANPYRMASGDFDGDGLPDLAIGSSSPNGPLTIVPGTGNGAFGAPLMLSGADTFLMAAADVDGNGLSDLVVLQSLIPKLALALGGFDFAPGMSFPQLYAPTDVLAADLNADGLDDLVMAASAFAPLAAVMAEGAGTFAPPVAIPFPVSGSIDELSISAGDVDGDGVLDVLLAVQHEIDESEVAMLRGSGTGTFEPAGSIAVPGIIRSVGVADVDRDDLPDVLVGTLMAVSGSSDLLMLYRGNGDGFVEPPLSYALVSTPYMLAVADGDRDGWPDAYAAGEHAVSVSMNRWGPWQDRGHALASAVGKPQLTGVGPLLPASVVGLELTGAAPEASATLVVGWQEGLSPFKGGVLVPSADVVVPAPPTDAEGKLLLDGTWPPGVPAATLLHFQMWIADGSAPQGYAASNALLALVP